jgi:DNA-directed RNA polymerase subunit L
MYSNPRDFHHQILSIVLPDALDHSATLAIYMKKKKIIYKIEKNIAIFTFYNENHTLGNLIRFFVKGNPDIEYVGYNVPNPSENIMNIKISVFNYNFIDPILISLKNCSEIGVLIGNFFNLNLENNSRKTSL